MNLAETHRLLTVIATIDNRRFDDATVSVWRRILDNNAYIDCEQAVTDHFRDRPDVYLMPGHIHAAAQQIASRRLGAVRKAKLDQQHALQTAETVDRTPDVIEMVERLAARMGTSDRDILRRQEWVKQERQRQRDRIGRNPNYDPRRAADIARRDSA